MRHQKCSREPRTLGYLRFFTKLYCTALNSSRLSRTCPHSAAPPLRPPRGFLVRSAHSHPRTRFAERRSGIRTENRSQTSRGGGFVKASVYPDYSSIKSLSHFKARGAAEKPISSCLSHFQLGNAIDTKINWGGFACYKEATPALKCGACSCRK